MSEKALCFPNYVLDSVGRFRGALPTPAPYLNAVLNVEHLRFLPRQSDQEKGIIGCEFNPYFKQLIPYIILRCGNRYFNYLRTSKSGEKRLHQKRSIGLGGHINESDMRNPKMPPDMNTYTNGFKRELEEEVKINCKILDAKIVGVLNEDETSVGRVHFGIVHALILEGEDVEILEDSYVDGRWDTRAFMEKFIGDFEDWSKFTIEGLLQ
jgi:predicted NUDIX family phosphoesterase